MNWPAVILTAPLVLAVLGWGWAAVTVRELRADNRLLRARVDRHARDTRHLMDQLDDARLELDERGCCSGCDGFESPEITDISDVRSDELREAMRAHPSQGGRP